MINLAKINKDETIEYFKAVETKTYIKTRKKLPKTLKMYLYLSMHVINHSNEAAEVKWKRE